MPECFTSLGPDHAVGNMGPTLTCPDYQMIPQLTREHRGQHFLARATPQEESVDLELDVVDVGDSGSEVTSSRFFRWGTRRTPR